MRKRNEEMKMKVYEYINEYIQMYRVSPSVREMAAALHCSISTIHKFLVRLEEEGKIERFGKRHITSSINSWEMDCVPVVGLVACGKPKLAIEDIQAYLPINKDFFGSGEYFGLVASGDSMINAGIDDGDIVIVRKQSTADKGQIVVAMVQDESHEECSATLKRFYRDKNGIRLHPENDDMEDIFVEDIDILGIAVKVIKNLV